MRYSSIMAFGLTSALAFAPSARANSIDTGALWDGGSTFESFGTGAGAAQTIGETFTAPQETLTGFTFYLDPQGGTIQFTPYVYVWTGALTDNGGNATGTALFTGSSTSVSGSGGVQTVAVNTGSLALTAGAQYVALLTVSGTADTAATTGAGALEYAPAQHGDGGDGGLVYALNGADLSLLTSTPWDTAGDFGSLVWQADFQAGSGSTGVPEPASAAVLGVALAGLMLGRRRSNG